MKYYIVAEVRESYPSLIDGKQIYNDYVSKKSIFDLVESLKVLGYDCEYLGGTSKLFELYKNKVLCDDIVFINYNYGLPSQYKRVQGPILLEMMNAKYSGSDPFTSLLVNDKAYSKKIVHNIGIATAKGHLLCNQEDIDVYISSEYINLPLVIKPNMEGSSLGINENSLCYTYNSAKETATLLLKTFPQVLVEEYIEGYECTVWIIGNPPDFQFIKPLIVSSNNKFYFENKIFTMNDKANHLKKYDLPSNILPSEITNKLYEVSKNIFTELGLRDYARFDYRIYNNEIYFIEANALPIFSKTSEIGAITKLYNISYSDICNTIVRTLNIRLMC